MKKLYQVEKVSDVIEDFIIVYQLKAKSKEKAIEDVKKGKALEVDNFFDGSKRKKFQVFEIKL